MGIAFDKDRWAELRDVHRRWWAGELERPLIYATLHGAATPLPEPPAETLAQANCHDFSVSPEAVVERWEYDLSRQRFLGDAFPNLPMACFGPGVMAAFLGARLDNSTGQVWFHPDRPREIGELALRYDPDNAWLRRLKALYRAAMERWDGLVQVGMTDLGGNLDILSTFRPGEGLPLDLLLEPEAVVRLTWDVHELWFRYYDELNAVLQPRNPGYSAWMPIYSETPYYILQCDFAYMIGPAQFDEFVKPELAATCRRLTNPFYHLDGIGQLPHLDSLLEIEELKGVQWVPGDGQPPLDQWPEVYRKIRRAGKRIQLFGDFQTLERVADQIGGAKGILLITEADVAEETRVRAELAKWR